MKPVTEDYRARAKPIIDVVAAPDPLLTLAEAKLQLEIDHSDRDTFIMALVAAASAMLDGFDGMIGKLVAEQTVDVSMPTASGNYVGLPVTPVQSLSAVSYYDADNVHQTININQFRLVGDEDRAWLETVEGFAWPAFYDRCDALTFTLVCGFPEVPEAIKHAARLMVGHWFENREAANEKDVRAIDMAVEALVGRYRIGWVGA